jgi:FkbM family methyltransferase
LYILRLKKLLFIFLNKLYLRAAFLYRVFPSLEHHFLWIRQFRTVVDIGANKGQFSLAARKNLKDAEIYAFEPQAKAAEIFSSIFKHDQKVHFFEIAIGPEKRESVMNISHSDDSSSLLKISDLQNSLFPDTYKSGSEVICEDTLESVLGRNNIIEPSLLKIDVQGYEMEVLKGSLFCLDKFTHIYCECSYLSLYEGQPLASDIVKFMVEHNFDLDGIYNTCHTSQGEAIQSDFLFKRASKVT